MIYELYWTREHEVTFTVQLIPGAFSGAPLPLRRICGGITPPRYYTPGQTVEPQTLCAFCSWGMISDLLQTPVRYTKRRKKVKHTRRVCPAKTV